MHPIPEQIIRLILYNCAFKCIYLLSHLKPVLRYLTMLVSHSTGRENTNSFAIQSFAHEMLPNKYCHVKYKWIGFSKLVTLLYYLPVKIEVLGSHN